MREKVVIRITLVTAIMVVCCLFGYKEKKTSFADAKSFMQESAMKSSYEFGDEIEMDGCKYVYEAGEKYFDKINYGGKKYFSLCGFTQKYDEAGNPIYKDIVIPDKINGIPVVVVAGGAFSNKEDVRSITFGKNIEEIGEYAFYQCKNLKKISLSQKVYEIRRGAFRKCSKLKSVTIPKKVQLIEWRAFQGCKSLEKVKFEGSPKIIENEVFTGTKWVDSCRKKGIPAIASGILVNAYGLSGHVKITGKDVRRIAGSAFLLSDVTSLEIDGVEEISEYGIRGEIKKIKIKNVKRLDPFCFAAMDDLETVVFGESISKIPGGCFDACGSIKTIKMYTRKKIKWGTPMAEYDSIGLSKRLMNIVPDEIIPTNIYLYSENVDSSIKKAVIKDYFVLHVPAKAVKKYKKYVSCKVVAM